MMVKVAKPHGVEDLIQDAYRARLAYLECCSQLVRHTPDLQVMLKDGINYEKYGPTLKRPYWPKMEEGK